jgi:hypothetical protein
MTWTLLILTTIASYFPAFLRPRHKEEVESLSGAPAAHLADPTQDDDHRRTGEQLIAEQLDIVGASQSGLLTASDLFRIDDSAEQLPRTPLPRRTRSNVRSSKTSVQNLRESASTRNFSRQKSLTAEVFRQVMLNKPSPGSGKPDLMPSQDEIRSGSLVSDGSGKSDLMPSQDEIRSGSLVSDGSGKSDLMPSQDEIRTASLVSVDSTISWDDIELSTADINSDRDADFSSDSFESFSSDS